MDKDSTRGRASEFTKMGGGGGGGRVIQYWNSFTYHLGFRGYII